MPTADKSKPSAKPHNELVPTGLQMPKWMMDCVDTEAGREGLTRSAVIRRALLQHYAKKKAKG